MPCCGPMESLADESGRLVVELHAAIQEMDPARWNGAQASPLRDRLTEIRNRLYGLVDERWPAEDPSDLRLHLREVGAALDSVPSEDGSFATAKAAWMAFRRQLVPRYEAARTALRNHAVHVPSLRPTNYTRSVFHAIMASTTIAILWALPDPAWGVAVVAPLFVWGWSMEWLRRSRPALNAKLMKLFGPVAHPHENERVNSATWYVTAIMLLSLTRSPLVCAIGIAALGFGDPAGALIGRRFGKVKLMHGRTLEGSLAFFVVGSLAAFGVSLMFAPTVAWPALLGVAAAGGAGGAFAELHSLRIDDNLSVPVVATVAAALMAFALGVPF